MLRAFSLSSSVFALGAVLALGASLSGCSGCGGDPGLEPCDSPADLDGDNYGDGCAAGPDCNENNPDIHEGCCELGPSQGCECDPSVDSVVACFDGQEALADVPPCMKGQRSCDPTTSTWGACGGQVLPEQEVCDSTDNDCDGNADEGVTSACGNCLPGCDEVSVGDDPFPFPEEDPAVGVDGVGLDPDGDLVLDQSTIESHFLWVANDPQGTVSKLDTRTGAEIARYATVTHEASRVRNHVGRTYSAWNSGHHRPSRTAIDFYGDVWVANRAPSTQPTITKIFNDEGDCVDSNGNGVIDTSRDVNGDNVITITDPLEFFAEADECIAMTVAIGNQSDYQARALAIDAGQSVEGGTDDPGNVWVGMYTEQAFYQIDGADGSLIQRVPPTGTLNTAVGANITPYGAAIDSAGNLWSIGGCCGSQYLIRIATGSNPAPVTRIATPSPGGAYGIAVDLEDRVWVGSYTGPRVDRYDPVGNAWVTVNIPDSTGWITRGVGIDSVGNVWAAMHGGATSRLARIDADTATVTSADVFTVGGNVAIGVGVDFDGDIWGVNQSTSNATRLHIDTATGEPAPHPTTGNIVDTFPTGPNPYTYSDFTGLALRTVTRPTGEYTIPIQGCMGDDQATWLGVDWQATTPPDTAVEIYVRAGDDLMTLNQATLYGPWTMPPADLQMPPGPVPNSRYLLLIIRLISQDREATPIVHGYSVEWACPGEPVD